LHAGVTYALRIGIGIDEFEMDVGLVFW